MKRPGFLGEEKKPDHSHKKWKDSMKTRVSYIEISLVSWNLPNGPKHQGSILKNMASSKEGQLIAGAFHTIRDKIEADMLQTAKKWNWKLIFTHEDTVLERFDQ